jgi:lysosomal alpha-mannosidase
MDNLRLKRAPNEMKGKSFTLQIDEQSGALKSITINGKTHTLRQSFKYYNSVSGVKNMEDSGSYQFCPNGTAHDFGAQKLISKFSSGSVHELHQQFSDYVTQTVRTYEDEDYIEFDWIVGPLPIDDDIGKEIVTRFESDLKNENIFYTDANGRQTVKRMFNPKSMACNNNVIPGNWYPIYSRISIKDEKEGKYIKHNI